jgi:hypothetical protein
VELELEITPEPSPGERAAVAAALAEATAIRRESAWWKAGLLDGVGDDLELDLPADSVPA